MDEKKMRSEVDEIVELVLKDYDQGRDIDNMNIFDQPDRDEVIEIVNKLLGVLFPGYYRDKGYRFYNMYSKLTLQFEDIMYYLSQQIALALACRLRTGRFRSPRWTTTPTRSSPKRRAFPTLP